MFKNVFKFDWLIYLYIGFILTYNHIHDSGTDNRTDKIPNKVLPHIILQVFEVPQNHNDLPSTRSQALPP